MKVLEPDEIEYERKNYYADYLIKLGREECLRQLNRIEKQNGSEYKNEIESLIKQRIRFMRKILSEYK